MTCLSPLGMESGHIPDQSIVASSRGSQYRGPEKGRLNLQLTGNRESIIILPFFDSYQCVVISNLF